LFDNASGLFFSSVENIKRTYEKLEQAKKQQLILQDYYQKVQDPMEKEKTLKAWNALAVDIAVFEDAIKKENLLPPPLPPAPASAVFGAPPLEDKKMEL
jgi:hypothetical protein